MFIEEEEESDSSEPMNAQDELSAFMKQLEREHT